MNTHENVGWGEPLWDSFTGEPDALPGDLEDGSPYGLEAGSGPSLPTPQWVIDGWIRTNRARLAREAEQRTVTKA